MAGAFGCAHTHSSPLPPAEILPPDAELVFPSEYTHGRQQYIKLPGQVKVQSDEYQEFLGLGHGEIFVLEIDR